jgi:formylglycine-generating enzyme required for sulfatase activity/serine/threonine protein kinase
MEDHNDLSCWNCKKTIENMGMNCPFCNVFIDKKMIERIAADGTSHIPSGGLRSGIVFDERYEIKNPLGQGGMGVVYKAHDKYMDRDVALKLIPKELSMDPKAIADLKRETALALDLTHEHIVRFYNLDTWESFTFVTMEYVQCGTLSHLMVEKGGSLSLGEALPLLTQVGQALDYAHCKNPPVVHLDLKPLNLLLTLDGCAKIADFGLARVLRDLATRVSAWEAAGSLAYMAPEQIRGKGIGIWTDVYALAAVAYELLSGQPPFYTGDLRWQIMHEEVDPILDMPEYVNKALLVGLAKDISMRPVTAGDFVKMLAGEISVPDIQETIEPKSEEVRKRSDAETEESSVWKEDWFKKFEVSEEETPQKSLKKPVLMYSIIAFLCLLVLGELGWILYTHNYINFGMVDRVVSVLLPDEKEPVAIVEKPPSVEKKNIISSEDSQTKKENIFKIPLVGEKEMAPHAIGGLSLATAPLAASIMIDDIEKGVSPLVLKDLPEGIHTVKVYKEGFQPWQGEISIHSSQVLELDIDLKPILGSITIVSKPKDALIPLPGKLTITSSPKKADVYLSGKSIGKTPVKLDKVREGKVLVEVRKSCYDSIKRTVSVLPGKEVKSKFVLKPSCGNVVVKSLPNGANWYLNGKSMGKTPGKTGKVEKGVYRIKVTKENYADWEVDATIKPKKNNPIIATLDLIAELNENLYIDPITGMEFVLVEKGCYKMGTPSTDKDRSSDEGPVHEVCVNAFWIGKYEVTQRQWVKVYGKNPSSFKTGEEYPVENVSWNDTQKFISKLNEMKTGKKVYRLPTEAEWEYACRSGGKSEKYSGGDQLDLVAWYKNNSMEKTNIVGKKKPNRLGLFDMSGNVFEWVEDVYMADAYLRHKPIDPIYRGEGSYKVCRGGSWLLNGKESRSTNRSYYFATSRNYNLGFRIVKNP